MSNKGLRVRRQLSGFMALFCWLFMFVLPSITLYYCLDWLFAVTMRSNYQKVAPQLVHEMKNFKEEATSSAFVQKALDDFFTAGGPALLDLTLSELREKMKSELGIAAECLGTHKHDTREVEVKNFATAEELIGFFPRRLSQKLFVVLNGQLQAAFYRKEGRRAISNLVKNDDAQKLRNDAESFVQSLFALPAVMPLRANKVVKSISGKLRGPVYFYYHPLYEQNADKKMVRGGFFVAICGFRLSRRQVLQAAADRGADRLQRRYVRSPAAIPIRFENVKEVQTAFVENENSYALTSTPRPETIVDLIQRGTLFPFKLEETAQRLPLLQVSIAKKHLQHPLQASFNELLAGLQLFVALGAILLLYLSLFGIEFRAGIRSKILLGIAIILLVPLISLAAAYLSWMQFQSLEKRYLQEAQQRMALESLQHLFSDYLTRLQNRTRTLAAELDKLHKKDAKFPFKKYLENLLHSSSATAISLDRARQGEIQAARVAETGLSKNEGDLARLTSRSLLNTFDEHGNYDPQNIAGASDFTMVNPEFVNELFNGWGRLQEYRRYNTGNRYSVAPLLYANSHAPYGLLTIKFSQETLTREFLRQKAVKELQKSYAGLDFSFYLVEKTEFGDEFYDLEKQHMVGESQLRHFLQQAAGGSSFFFNDGQGRDFYVRYFVGYPLLAVAGSKLAAGHVSLSGAAPAVFAYVLLLVFLIYKVFGKIYLQPVAEFIRTTERIGQGDFKARANIVSGDEFGELQRALSEMSEGLAEKELMSQFVSKDVITAVHGESATSMAPGGEKVEATVAFVQLADIADCSQPGEILQRLSEFIEVAEAETERFGGVIDKVIDDKLMLVFRSNQLAENHAIAASIVVMQLLRHFGDLRAGIAGGTVLSGRIGSHTGKLDYTVIGDTVNLAARLQALARSEARIIIAPSSIRKLRGLARVNFIETVTIKGKTRQYPLYELYGLREKS